MQLSSLQLGLLHGSGVIRREWVGDVFGHGLWVMGAGVGAGFSVVADAYIPLPLRGISASRVVPTHFLGTAAHRRGFFKSGLFHS